MKCPECNKKLKVADTPNNLMDSESCVYYCESCSLVISMQRVSKEDLKNVMGKI